MEFRRHFGRTTAPHHDVRMAARKVAEQVYAWDAIAAGLYNDSPRHWKVAITSPTLVDLFDSSGGETSTENAQPRSAYDATVPCKLTCSSLDRFQVAHVNAEQGRQ